MSRAGGSANAVRERMSILGFFILCSLFLAFPGSSHASPPSAEIAGYPAAEARLLGERMYREGILPSGEPMKAVVMGNIPVDGRMFACDDCHQRSGIGSVEGNVITWPTNGRSLYAPRRSDDRFLPPQGEEKSNPRRNLPPLLRSEDVRPAYTDETLARALRLGTDPSGRRLNPEMPRYILGDRDMAVLIHYLKNLSSVLSPGVDGTTITFATVVTEGVPRAEREAMLAVLRAHVDTHNAQSRSEEKRARANTFYYKTEKLQAYRRLKLLVWELSGPPDTWREQLDARYRQEPVFGLLGGMAAGSWAPIHAFCEENRIPAIFPLTDLPVVSDANWYSLYFSKGVYQEGEAAANYLHRVASLPRDARVVQVLRKDPRADALSRGFEEDWKKSGRPVPARRVLGPKESLTGRLLSELGEGGQPAVLLLWLDARDVRGLAALEGAADREATLFLSFTLLGGDLSVVPEALRDRTYVTYPYVLPHSSENRLYGVMAWLKQRRIPVTNLHNEAGMYFLGGMLSGVLKRMRSEYFREYFLEGFDMNTYQEYAVSAYPRLSFGPGQRYAAKGCYIVQLGEGPDPDLVPKSDWIIR
jgi:hypothetical protein